MKNKKGFIMWGDFFKGTLFGLIVGITLILLIVYGIIPLPFSISFC
jgi:hypothetical protein